MGDGYLPYSGRKNITRWLNATWEKVAYITVYADHIGFHNLHNPDSIKDYHEWLWKRINKERYGSYQEYFKNIIGKHKPDQYEIESFEMFLFYGGDIVSGGGSGRLAAEKRPGEVIKNSQWDTPFAFLKIREKRKSGWSYDQIVNHFKKNAPPEYRDKITSVRLRQIYSRGLKMVAKYHNSYLQAVNTL